jgi:hypothetical protein
MLRGNNMNDRYEIIRRAQDAIARASEIELDLETRVAVPPRWDRWETPSPSPAKSSARPGMTDNEVAEFVRKHVSDALDRYTEVIIQEVVDVARTAEVEFAGDIASLRVEVSALRDEVSRLRDMVNSLSGDVSAIEGDVANNASLSASAAMLTRKSRH